jgi:hypothetical protein
MSGIEVAVVERISFDGQFLSYARIRYSIYAAMPPVMRTTINIGDT